MLSDSLSNVKLVHGVHLTSTESSAEETETSRFSKREETYQDWKQWRRDFVFAGFIAMLLQHEKGEKSA